MTGDPPEAIALGEAIIDFVPDGETGDLARVARFRKTAGGAPANLAVGLARLGVPTGFVGRVGNDPFGRFLAATLAAEGVDVTHLRPTDEAATALAFVALDVHGERDFAFYRTPGADTRLSPADVAAAPLQAARLVHFGGLALTHEPARGATLAAAAQARAAGQRVSFDANLRPPLWPDRETARRYLAQGVRAAGVVKLSEEEARFLAGEAGGLEAAARRLWHPALQVLLVTRGAAGALALTADHAAAVAGLPVAAVDATGAGDAFLAAFLARTRTADIADPVVLQDALEYANTAGALAVTRPGAIPALPDAAAIEAALARGAGGGQARPS